MTVGPFFSFFSFFSFFLLKKKKKQKKKSKKLSYIAQKTIPEVKSYNLVQIWVIILNH
jgi:hypothetical protein